MLKVFKQHLWCLCYTKSLLIKIHVNKKKVKKLNNILNTYKGFWTRCTYKCHVLSLNSVGAVHHFDVDTLQIVKIHHSRTRWNVAVMSRIAVNYLQYLELFKFERNIIRWWGVLDVWLWLSDGSVRWFDRPDEKLLCSTNKMELLFWQTRYEL